MSKDIFGNYFQSEEEIAIELINNNRPSLNVFPKMGTKQGYYLIEGFDQISGVHKTGFYAFFLGDKCVYVGSSMNDEKGITNRISRFVKGVQGNYDDKKKEWHSAAEKFRCKYGTNFSDLKLMLMKYPKVDVKKAEKIERELILKLKPMFNKRS
jgi:calcineurin-like phosphoesterase family protein